MADRSQVIASTKSYLAQQSAMYGDLYAESWSPQAKSQTKGTTLDSLCQEKRDCTACELSAARTNVVFGIGPADAKVMCIGEAPGSEEDLDGKPFVGAAGQLLDKILAAIGFSRDEVYIANIVKCRPPGNRDPEPEEISECLPILNRQIEMINPVLILVLGKVAAQTLLAKDGSLNSMRGTSHAIHGVQAVVTYHPAALLRNSQFKRDTWQDVRSFRKLYDELVGDKPALDHS